ncbi:MAG TPA: hypothetical protein VGO89_22135, partial [Streptomyces sp.]|nr:hypothetical protein [Streptomyces sp.]
QPWAPLSPGAAIMITVGALNILADAIRDSTGAATGSTAGAVPAPRKAVGATKSPESTAPQPHADRTGEAPADVPTA